MSDQADMIAWLEEYHAQNGDTRPCKVDGCEQPAETKLGPYGGLCAEHKVKLQNAKKRPQRPRPVSVRTLVDRARIVEEKQAAYLAARKELEEALGNLHAAIPVVDA